MVQQRRDPSQHQKVLNKSRPLDAPIWGWYDLEEDTLESSILVESLPCRYGA